MFVLMKELDPVGVEERRKDAYNRHGTFQVPGPNFLWSIDGHLKLQAYGIEIYAGIDGYARYVPWIYVGVSGRTATSILKQYLEAIESGSFNMPFAIRSDHGTETVLIANAHWQLHQANRPNIPFKDIYFYGTSTLNQRIESWWQRLSRGQTKKWRNFFHTLGQEGYFDGSDADIIAILAVFIPILRFEVLNWVHLWNIHTIRKQKSRPGIIDGKPFMNYFHPTSSNPSAKDCAQHINPEVFHQLKQDVADYGMLTYTISKELNSKLN